LGVFVTAKVKKMNFPLCADIILPGVMIAQALGRWGNFFNGEAYGGIVSEGNPLYFLRMGIFPNNVATGLAYVHPTFLYESLWNVLGFVIINILWNKGKKKFDGEVALWYATWYGFGRMFIEGLRTDSLYVGPIRISQLVGLICFVAGASLIAWRRVVIYKKEKDIKEVVENGENN
jgi:phosphatidylglycerol:prolipoprotein diacylglycerol transferase